MLSLTKSVVWMRAQVPLKGVTPSRRPHATITGSVWEISVRRGAAGGPPCSSCASSHCGADAGLVPASTPPDAAGRRSRCGGAALPVQHERVAAGTRTQNTPLPCCCRSDHTCAGETEFVTFQCELFTGQPALGC